MNKLIKISIVICFCVFIFCIPSNAQAVKFPEVKPFEINGRNKILGSYQPAGAFARAFPDFLNDGKYFLDNRFTIWGGPNLSYLEYPAIFTTTSNKLDGFGDILVSVSFEDAGIYDLKNAEILNYPKEYNLKNKFYAIEYGKLNELYKVTVENLFKEKNANHISFINFASRNYLSDRILPTTLMFDFRHTGALILQQKFAADLPSYERYALTIRNSFGEVIKTYNQIIFASLKVSDYGYDMGMASAHFTAPLFNQTFAAAFESLINQFLNDIKAVSTAQAQQKEIVQKIQRGIYTSQLIAAKIKFGALMSRKEELMAMGKDIKSDFDGLSAFAASSQNMANNYIPNPSASTQLNQTASAVNSLGSNLIYSMIAHSEEKKDKAKLDVVYKLIGEYNEQLNAYVKEVQGLPGSPDRDQLMANIEQNSNGITDVINSIHTAQQDANTAMTASRSKINQSLQNLRNTLQNGSAGAAGAAITSSGPLKTETSCMKQTTAAWKSSNEYLTYMRTKSNADMKDCEAKLIELTVRFCRDSLSQQEIAADNKASAEARQAAKDMRSGGFKYKN